MIPARLPQFAGDLLEAEAANYPWLTFTGIHKDYCGNVRFVSYKEK